MCNLLLWPYFLYFFIFIHYLLFLFHLKGFYFIYIDLLSFYFSLLANSICILQINLIKYLSLKIKLIINYYFVVKLIYMRKEIIENVIKEVIGPREGCFEIIPYDPWEEYLCGVVIPRMWMPNKDGSADNPDEEELKEDNTDFDDDSLSDEIGVTTQSELDPRYQTKSFGISFVLDSLDPQFEVCTTWGMYTKEIEDESKIVESDDSIDWWSRKSYGEITHVNFEDNENHLKYIVFSSEELGEVYLYVKRIILSDNKSHISVYLVNDLLTTQTKEDFHPNIQSCMFQPSIRINFLEGDSLLNMDPISSQSSELKFLYREKPVKASGHMCSAIWKNIDYYYKFDSELMWPDGIAQSEKDSAYDSFIVPDVRSEFVPIYPMPLSSFDIEGDVILSADELSELFDAEGLSKKLYQLTDCYHHWIEENKSSKTEDIDSNIFDTIIRNERLAFERMEKGIRILKDNPIARLSFCFANKAIALQNAWAGRDEFKWRPYQVAFFLMNIDSLVNKDSNDKDILDLLWIPTGGGKTEAYLAIMAFVMSFRRITAYLSNDKTSGGGVSVISRYTLRLLTIQQFRRTLKLVTAAEFLRIHENEDGSIGWRPQTCDIEGDWIYGSMRYSAGMWVGGGVSPLRLLDKEIGAMDILKEDNKDSASQLIKCPVCGNWLAIPENGITKEGNKIHIVLKLKYSETDVETKVESIVNKFKEISKYSITFENHLNYYFTLSLTFKNAISKNKLGEIFDYLNNDFEFASLNKFKLGYFNSLSKIKGKQKEDAYDFEIWCTNPNCRLNHVHWKEGIPFKESNYRFPDGNYEHLIESPFIKNTRMPIPGYTIDEHVYYRCPTVIISTADKIARLAFEPRASALFGNINKYNKYYGYYRDFLVPKNSVKKSLEDFVNVLPFKSPDLIIQDELHLMDGPLGSLFGLYETMVDAIIRTSGGNPKYIASTATINNADKQATHLFSKELFQFPPSGLDIDDSFFVKQGKFDEGFDEKNPGRLYMGVYAPGKGPMTPQVRLWARILKASKDLEGNELISKYWTLVGYYNSIRELGGGIALYNDDIRARLNNITEMESKPDAEGNYDVRELGSENLKELSSRIDSTKLSLILDEMERDGFNNKKPDFDAIFTTSMFGTGVDISHLSLMIMTSQPKTTGDYIQATGRIGRDNGGLIVTFFKSGRPRDLNHYEMFASYHSRIHLDIEPVAVSPFSKGALDKGFGPSMVAFLRNASNLNVKWYSDDAKIVNNKGAEKDFNLLKNLIKERLINAGVSEFKLNEIMNIFEANVDKWKNMALNSDVLKFNEYNPFHPLRYDVVLGDLAHESEDDLEVVYENAPQSLREIEETIGFWV